MNPRFWVLTVLAITALIVIAAILLSPAVAGLLKGITSAAKIQLKSARNILRGRGHA